MGDGKLQGRSHVYGATKATRCQQAFSLSQVGTQESTGRRIKMATLSKNSGQETVASWTGR